MEKFILRHFNLIRTIIAVLIGLVISVFLIYVVSKDPGFSLQQMLLGPFLSRSRFSNLIETASPILLCGLAIAVAFQARQFNVGAEGSLYLGAAVGTAFAVLVHQVLRCTARRALAQTGDIQLLAKIAAHSPLVACAVWQR